MFNDLLSIFYFKIESKLKKDIIEKKHDDNEEIMGKVIHIPKWKHKKISETVKCYTSVKKLSTSTEVLIPLTPLQIYNVRMYPTLFAFGMVNFLSLFFKKLRKIYVCLIFFKMFLLIFLIYLFKKIFYYIFYYRSFPKLVIINN